MAWPLQLTAFPAKKNPPHSSGKVIKIRVAQSVCQREGGHEAREREREREREMVVRVKQKLI